MCYRWLQGFSKNVRELTEGLELGGDNDTGGVTGAGLRSACESSKTASIQIFRRCLWHGGLVGEELLSVDHPDFSRFCDVHLVASVVIN
jgi:hypothetical protein